MSTYFSNCDRVIDIKDVLWETVLNRKKNVNVCVGYSNNISLLTMIKKIPEIAAEPAVTEIVFTAKFAAFCLQIYILQNEALL